MPRRIRPDSEGYLYWAQTPSGYLYGPYGDHGHAAGVLTVEAKYSTPRAVIWDSRLRQYVSNPDYVENAPRGKVVKTKVLSTQDAPKLSVREKLEAANARVARLERFLTERGLAMLDEG